MADVVIVGAGIVGLSTAFHLSKLGVRDIVVAESRYVGAGASGKSGAIIRTHYSNEHETRLAQEGLRFFEHWDEIVGGDCGFTRTGLVVIVSRESETDASANVDMQRRLGIEASIVDAEELRALDPNLRLEDDEIAVFEPGAGVTEAMAVCNTLAAALRRAGVSIKLETPVLNIRETNGRVTGVETPEESIDADAVVVAPGAFANSLLGPLGYQIPMVPVTSRIAIFRWPEDRDPRHPAMTDNVNGLWLRPIFGDSTLIGAERAVKRVVEDPENADETIDQEYVDHCRAELARRYPVMRHAIGRGGWTGILMRSADGKPIIGPFHGHQGLYGLVGDSGTSFKTAPAVGRALAELIVEGESESDLSPFGIDRFQDGDGWIDEHQYRLGSTISR